MRKTYTFLIKVILTLCIVMTGSKAWAEDTTITWTVSGVQTTASGGSNVNTALKATISPDGASGTWTAVAQNSYAGSNQGAQFGSNSYKFNGTISLSNSSIPSTATIKSVIITLKSSSSPGYKISTTVGGQSLGSQVTTENSSSNKDYKFTGGKVGNDIVITFSDGSKKNVIIKEISVTYEEAATSTLSSIALSGDYPTTFTIGDEFSYEGMTVTATYEDASTRDVTYSASFTGYNMSSNGEQTVTVSYTEGEVTKTTTYDINVKLAAELAFSETAISVDMGGTNSINFSKATNANVSFEVEDETIAKYYPATGIIAGLKEGTTTLIATSVENDDYAPGEATCTITVRDPNWIDLTAQGYSNAEIVTTVVGTSGTITFAKGTHKDTSPAWYDSGSAVRVYVGNTVTINAKQDYVITEIVLNTTSGSLATGYFSPSGTLTKTDKVYTFTPSSPNSEITITNSGSGTFRIDKVKISVAEPATITLAAACTDGNGMYYGTYSKGTAFVVPADLTVSEITIVDNKLQVNDYETGAIVPANTGVMVSSATAGEHTVALASGGTSVLGDNNMLKASGDDGKTAAQMDAENTLFYRLTMHNGTTIGYYWGAENGAAFAIAANKAYLAVPASAAAQLRGFTFDDVATSITDINTTDNTKGDNAIYNLSGQRVTEGYKGIVIRNGKKYLVK